jgi:uncharacterized protein (UPF0276 family)
MSRAVLAHVADQIDLVQNRLRRRILIENPSRMLAFANDELPEADLLNGLAQRTGCGILLDLNNVEVSATNLGLSPSDYLDRIDFAHVGEIHMAGHTREQHACWPLAIDDHGSAPTELGWALLQQVLDRCGPRPILIEWDTDVPEFDQLLAEAGRADAMVRAAGAREAARHALA